MSINALSRVLRGAGIASLVAFLFGCSSSFSPQDEKDLALVGAACKTLKEPEKQTACVDAAVRLTAKNVPETAIPKMPPPPPPLGKAREEISFKDTPFDQPAQKDKLIATCQPELKGLDGMAFDTSCPKGNMVENSAIDFVLPYGTSRATRASFIFAENGSLMQVSMHGPPEEIQSHIELLSEKYGPPLIETSEVQSTNGTKFEKKVATWTDARGTEIVATTRTFERIGGDLNYDREHLSLLSGQRLRLAFQGKLTFRSAAKQKMDQERSNQGRETALKNL